VGVEHFERRCCHLSYMDAEPNVNANPIAISNNACLGIRLPCFLLICLISSCGAWHTYAPSAPLLPHHVLVFATEVSRWRVDIEAMSCATRCSFWLSLLDALLRVFVSCGDSSLAQSSSWSRLRHLRPCIFVPHAMLPRLFAPSDIARYRSRLSSPSQS
jgi:hypothetical protein